MLTACTSKPQISNPEPDTHLHDPTPMLGWHYLRFRFARDGDEVDSYLDGLIAHQLLASIIDEYNEGIELWRFHRRWPRDETGHQFSFILLTTPTVAQRIYTEVGAAQLLDHLRDEGHLLTLQLEKANSKHIGDPAATSDRSWPSALQREWPHFIMGASRMWLGLVAAEAEKHSELSLHARYRAVETTLDELWFRQANHALFHHLSALFGYKPMRVIRRDIMTF